MKWKIDPSFDPMQDLQDLKEQVIKLQHAVIAGQQTTEHMINTLQMQQRQIEGYKNQNLRLMEILNSHLGFLDAK